MPYFEHAGLRFHYLDAGAGRAVVLQHGLGANAHQPEELYRPGPGFRFLAMDARNHGETQPTSDPAALNFNTLADDLAALLDHLGIEGAVIGGVSMGAGLALNFALRFPARVQALVLSRPAWLDQPLPDNLRCLVSAARFIRQYGPVEGLPRFQTTEDYQAVLRQSVDSANSLVKQFGDPRAREAVDRLERIPQDAPNRERAAWATIGVPTLVLTTQPDLIHPEAYGVALAAAIPGAERYALTPQSVSREQYQADTQARLTAFLNQHFRQ
ncbi:MAG: alpha/beta hydrolase [Anaerolineales bacterium]|nr:alpha/beta hydrolase [Anaerolineales bacterium]